jgi:acetylornithine deacetylase/succinyl-diaminopimelate desuccinylase-like protein
MTVTGATTRFTDDLAAFVSFASVSSQPAHGPDVRRCADWLAGRLAAIGLDRAGVVPTEGQPVVTAEWRRRAAAPTLLIYGHYDVQPADPVRAWDTPPFMPVLRGVRLAGRGASDDKGQLLAHVHALEAWLRATGALPVNVVCLFEGEEEIGSPSLRRWLGARGHPGSLPGIGHVDAAVVSDTPILGPTRPTLVRSLRGSVALELRARSAAGELHSGVFGGAVAAPLEALCCVLASMHDPGGHITVDGFYDRVRGPVRDGAERDVYTTYERATIRPALTVAGVGGGYAGLGIKAVVPSRAIAKLDVRLVPDQRPDEIAAQLRRHVCARAPAGVAIEVRLLAASPPATIDLAQPAALAAARAYARGFRVAPVVVRSGGSVPVVPLLQDELGIPTVLMGFGLPDDLPHAPNESAHLPTLRRAVQTCICFHEELGRAWSRT